MNIRFCCCAALAFHFAGCSLFNPQEPQIYGDVQVQVRMAEAKGTGTAASQPGSEVRVGKALALDRFVITVSSYAPQLEEVGHELVRREAFVGEDGRVRVAVRVPLTAGDADYYLAEVEAFQGLDLIYSGSDLFQFDADNKKATVSIQLQPVAFGASFFPQSNLPRFVMGQAFAYDSTLTSVDFEGNDIGVSVPLGRASQANHAILLWGDTTLVKARAWQRNVFRGEVKSGFRYPGPAADVLIACTWSLPVNFNLEVSNPLGQIISENLPGDVANGNGVLLISSAAYGPEVFEWRTGRITAGPFIVSVSRASSADIGTGMVYVIRRERTSQQTSEAFPFEFRPSDTQNSKQVFSFSWP